MEAGDRQQDLLFGLRVVGSRHHAIVGATGIRAGTACEGWLLLSQGNTFQPRMHCLARGGEGFQRAQNKCVCLGTSSSTFYLVLCWSEALGPMAPIFKNNIQCIEN
eukprot:6475688-Amphidinium_carterae.1